MTPARQTVLGSARLSPPSAWIVSPSGGRTGWERVAWRKNCQWLAGEGYLYANAHGDFTLTAKGEAWLEAHRAGNMA